jgi:pimeloyl-ACP methyl ester carboxylesterase
VHAQYRSVLGAWPVPHEEIRLPTCQGETFVVASGPADAPAVVLLHGGAVNSAMWNRNVQTWARSFRLYAVDIIGEPGFSAPSRPALSSDAYARWMDDVLAGLKLSRVAFVGASLGGLLALDYAIRRPASVCALVLLAPVGIARLRAKYLFSVVPLYFLGAWGRRKALDLLMGLPPEERTPTAERFLKSCELIMSHHLIRTQPLPVFPDAALRKLRMPVLTVVGARDIVFNSNTIRRRLQTCVDAARLIWLDTAGHGLTDQTAAIGEFLSSKLGSSPAGS